MVQLVRSTYAEGFCHFYHFKIYSRNSLFLINAVAAEIEKFRPTYLRLAGPGSCPMATLSRYPQKVYGFTETRHQ